MRKAALVCVNLLLPGSGQAALGPRGVGVVLSAAFGLSLSAAIVNQWVAPGAFGASGGRLLWSMAAGAWLASQVLLVLGLRRRRSPETDVVGEGLRETARLWLCGKDDEARALLEALVEHRPEDPALHYVSSVLAGAPTEARRHLAAAEGCDEDGRWREAVARERERLTEGLAG
jgi:hypothetical protein